MNKQENFDAPQKKKNIKILVCHHKKGPYIKNDCVMPIQVGKALHDVSLDYCIGDDTGDNISRKNKSWCELTALYWAWKNLDADYYGLMHYRRYLSFTSDNEYYSVTSIEHPLLQKSLSEHNIYAMCDRYDIITGPIWPIHPFGIDTMIMTAYDFYKKEHIVSDMDAVLKVIHEKFPAYDDAARDEMNADKCFFMNLMLLRSDLFHQYCEFLFGVLEEVEKVISLEGRDPYQYRVFGFLAERLSNIFVNYCRRNSPALRIGETGMFFLAETNDVDVSRIYSIQRARKPLDAPSTEVNVCMSFDDNYMLYGATALLSLTENTNASVNVYLLCDAALSENSRATLRDCFDGRCSIHFIDVDDRLLKDFPLNRDYISINTYYRLLLHVSVPVDKIIYLDSDIIVLDDIVKLWNFDMDGHCIAGVLDEGGVAQTRRLSMNYETNYVNAGIMVFDLKAIRAKFSDPMRHYTDVFLQNRKFIILQDQDILNLAFYDDLAVLPLKWNVNGRIFDVNEIDHKYTKEDIRAALDDIGILHFTDRKKPWTVYCKHPLRGFYWSYRKKLKKIPLGSKERLTFFLQQHFTYQIQGGSVLVGTKGSDAMVRLPKRPIKRTLEFLRKFSRRRH